MALSHRSLALLVSAGLVAALSVAAPGCTDDVSNPCTSGEPLPPLVCYVGACAVFRDACLNGLPQTCESPVPLDVETQDGIDNDCDGVIDDGFSCAPFTTQSCYSGYPEDRWRGVCHVGIQVCQDGFWSDCTGDVRPSVEVCNQLDDDCDGEIDEGCPCVEGQRQACYGGPSGAIKSPCRAGEQVCSGGRWGDCIGDLPPSVELGDGIDNDCNGLVDEGWDCMPKETRYCYEGPDGTDGVSVCHGGIQTCKAGLWNGPCEGQMLPTVETCNNIDDDCDGDADSEDSDIEQGDPCLTGLLGPCAQGVTQCSAQGLITCKQLTPQTGESCNGVDDDCDGVIDLVIGLDGSLYPIVGEPSTCVLPGVLGECAKGQNVCGEGGTFHCVQVNFPTAEDCGAEDEDCDGLVNNGDLCCLNNNLKDGSETDINCGGACSDVCNANTCQKCPPNNTCVISKDCDSGVCVNGVCQVAHCSDLVKNDQETDIDCGGPKCAPCDDFKTCKVGSDCVNKSCPAAVLTCQPPSCADMSQNALETDIDCGGPFCLRCNDGRSCTISADCQSGVCAGGFCVAPTCADAVQNGAEADVDCGGFVCVARCQAGKKCAAAIDCASGVCLSNICQNPACNDFVKNGSETGVDCGGPDCVAGCMNGASCSGPNDCISKVCGGNVCQAQTCLDTVKNGFETAIDCGGPDCWKCDDFKACVTSTDCKSAVCTNGICQVPVCSDSTENGTETDVDCGGGCAAKCADLKKCKVGSDCASKVCGGANLCLQPSCYDGFKNGLETDVDCGGVCANKCNNGNGCVSGGDCTSAHCNVPGGGGPGVCVECLVASSCPGVDTECLTRTCMNNLCGFSFAPGGTIIAGQLVGDCKVNQCNGAGQIISVVNNNDKPIDGNTCTQDVCSSGVPSNPPTAIGAPCAQGGGSFCDGAGVCVQCLNGAGCASGICVGGQCQVATCSDHVKNGGETDIDCGGPACVKCAQGAACSAGSDCLSGVCSNLICG